MIHLLAVSEYIYKMAAPMLQDSQTKSGGGGGEGVGLCPHVLSFFVC